MLALHSAAPTADPTLVTVSSGTVALAIAVLAGVLVAFVVTRVARLGLPGSGLGDRLRSYVYLERFGIALDLRGFGDRRRRAAVAELRANLEDAVRASGMAVAVSALGPARNLAASVSEGRPRPTWSVGLIAGVIGVGVSLAIHLFALGIWVSAAEASGADWASGTSSVFPWANFSYDRGGDFMVGSPWLLIIPAVAFLLWSRPWRIRQGRAN
jgi:hypothetical protein